MPRPFRFASAALFAFALAACSLTDDGDGDGAKKTDKNPGGSSAEADTAMGAVDWSTTATLFRSDTNLRVAYECPANGSAGTVWGTDIYTDDSSVCTAGVHAGQITLAKGGRVVIKMTAGLPSYSGSTRNGVTTYDWSTSWLASFVFL